MAALVEEVGDKFVQVVFREILVLWSLCLEPGKE